MTKRNRQSPVPASNSQQSVQAQFQSFSSPYPLPQQLDAFEKFAPGSAKEVITTAQESIRHQQRMQEMAIKAQIDLERSVRESDHHKNVTVRWVLVLAIAGAFVLACLNKSTASYVLLFSELAALVGAFLYGKNKQP